MAGLGGQQCNYVLHIFTYSKTYELHLLKGDETPSALLLAQAALLSTKKNAGRRAALWYVSAATRLEKCGIVSTSATLISSVV